jgi:hypothetical protein
MPLFTAKCDDSVRIVGKTEDYPETLFAEVGRIGTLKSVEEAVWTEITMVLDCFRLPCYAGV